MVPSFKSLYKKRYWLALLIPVSCVAGIAPTGSPYIFGAEAYYDFIMGNMVSRTIPPSEVPGLKAADFHPVWCVKWSHSGLDGGTLGYTCGGNYSYSYGKNAGASAVYVREEIGWLGKREGRPITAISLLDDNAAGLLLGREKTQRELSLLENSVVYLNPTDGDLPLELTDWRLRAREDWDALTMHHDGGWISRTWIGSHAAMWNIYVLLLIVIFVMVDTVKALFRLFNRLFVR